jgi:outer membrane receptor for ferrienterochelin and colicins
MLLDKGNLEIPYFETAFDNYFSTIRSTAKIETSYSPGKERQWSLVAAYSGYDRIKNRYLKNLTTLEKFLTPNLDDQDTTTMSNILLRAWYNQNEKFRKVNYQAGIDFNLEEGTGKRILDEKQQIGDYAAFLSIKYDPLKTVSMQPGIRLIYNTKYHAPLVYSLNMKWNPIEKLALRATYARGFKSPAIKELYLYFVDINHNVRGNPFLKAEYSNNYNLNISYNSETTKSFFSTDAGIFYNNIDNNIALAPEGNDLYTYINIGKYISKGFTVNTSWNLYPALTLVFGFSRTGQSFAFDAPGIKSATTYWNNDLTANFTYRFSKIKTTFSAYYKYTGRSPQVNPGDTESIAVGWVGDFNTLDASLMKAFWRNHLTVSAGAKNLFNVFTVPAVGSVSGAHSGGGGDSQSIAWGRTYFVKLAYSFNKYN